MGGIILTSSEMTVWQEWGEYLAAREWHYIVTVTFGKWDRDDKGTPIRVGLSVKPERAQRAIRDLYKRFKCDRAFSAAELFRLGGSHAHALLHFRPGVVVPTVEEIKAYSGKTYGDTKVEPVMGKGASFYVSKFSGCDSFQPPDILGGPEDWKI